MKPGPHPGLGPFGEPAEGGHSRQSEAWGQLVPGASRGGHEDDRRQRLTVPSPTGLLRPAGVRVLAAPPAATAPTALPAPSVRQAQQSSLQAAARSHQLKLRLSQAPGRRTAPARPTGGGRRRTPRGGGRSGGGDDVGAGEVVADAGSSGQRIGLDLTWRPSSDRTSIRGMIGSCLCYATGGTAQAAGRSTFPQRRDRSASLEHLSHSAIGTQCPRRHCRCAAGELCPSGAIPAVTEVMTCADTTGAYDEARRRAGAASGVIHGFAGRVLAIALLPHHWTSLHPLLG